MSDICLIIKNYTECYSKRQPWYSVRALSMLLKSAGYTVDIKSSIEDVGKCYSGVVIKAWSLKDAIPFISPYKNKSYALIYLVTFPHYTARAIFNLKPSIIFGNFKGMLRILIGAILPNYFIKESLSFADLVVTISDRSNMYMSKLCDPLLYIPFIKDNWGGETYTPLKHETINVGYFGSPISTRGYDDVIKYFCDELADDPTYQLKLITRIERHGLFNDQNKFLPDSAAENIKIVSGFLDRSQLAIELQDIDVLILPFKIVLSELPIVILEAIEFGIPLITTHECGLYETFQDVSLDGVLIVNGLDKNNYTKVTEFIRTNKKRPDFKLLDNRLASLNEAFLSSVRDICQK